MASFSASSSPEQQGEDRVVLGYFSRERNVDVCSSCFEKMSGTAQEIFLSTVGCVAFHSAEERGFSLASVQCDLCQVQFGSEEEEEDDAEDAAEMEGVKKSVQRLEATRASIIISLCHHTTLSIEDIAQAAYPFHSASKLGSEDALSVDLLEECVSGGCDRSRAEAILAELEQRSKDVSSSNSNLSTRRPHKHINTLCTFFARNGQCRNGDGCRFSHDLSLLEGSFATPMYHASAYHTGGRFGGGGRAMRNANGTGRMMHTTTAVMQPSSMQVTGGWGAPAAAPALYPYLSNYGYA